MGDEWQAVKTKRRSGRKKAEVDGDQEKEEPKAPPQPRPAPRSQPQRSPAEEALHQQTLSFEQALAQPRYRAPSVGFASEVQSGTGVCAVISDAAEAAVWQLEQSWPCAFFVARIWVPAVPRADAPANTSTCNVHARILPRVDLSGFSQEGIIIHRRAPWTRYPEELWIGVLTWLEPKEAEEAIFAHCMRSFQTAHDANFERPDAWRFSDCYAFGRRFPGSASRKQQEPYFTGEPLALEVVSGPHSHIPDDIEGPKMARACNRCFAVGEAVDINKVARSDGTAELQQLLRLGLTAVFAPDARGVTPLHLAALSGNVAVAKAAAECARNHCPARSWRDRNGRTPLHYAAFFDSPELVRALWGFGECDTKDRWGRTALDLALGLGHCAAAAALAQEPQTLRQLCEQRVLRLLRGSRDEAAAALGKMEGLPSGMSLRSCVPLHEHSALQRLAEIAPGEVEPADLLRAMSCMECWYADLLNCACSSVVPGCLELLWVWNEPDSFQGGEAEADDDGVILVRSPANAKVSPLADRETFIERFHRRTGGVLAHMDWSNVMVIGGMVLACLTATDAEYEQNYKETDVDIYIVGLSGKAFEERVAEVVSAMPGTRNEDDFCFRLPEGYTLPVTETRQGLLVNGQVRQPRKGGPEYCGERMPQTGDLILEVDDKFFPDEMEQQLKVKTRSKYAHSRDEFEPHVVKVRPCKEVVAADRHCHSHTLLRTPQTLTAVLRTSQSNPLPNVQVVLAPYASPAHLLFTTDLDCVAMGFDGKHLLATPRAREALRRRRNIVRPEKYAVRGEWRTEARLLKYATRGFRVVDIGLRPGAKAPACPEATAAAEEAEPLTRPKKSVEVSSKPDQPPRRQSRKKKDPEPEPAAPESMPSYEACVRRVRDSGVHGARLLLLASRDINLLRLMLHEEPLLRAGTDHGNLMKLVREHRMRRGRDDRAEGNSGSDDDEEGDRLRAQGSPMVNREGSLEMDDGYGGGTFELLMVNPSRLNGQRVRDWGLRGLEVGLKQAITELDLEADRFEVRSWYEGLLDEDLQPHATLDPQTWRGIGDFRAAA